MSGPRRHGARTARAVAACTLAFLALSAVLLRGGAASAHPAHREHGRGTSSQGGLLGGVLGSVGQTLNGTLDGLTGLLKPTASAPPTTATPSTPPTTPPTEPAASTTPPPTSAVPTARPRPSSAPATGSALPTPSREAHRPVPGATRATSTRQPLQADPVAATRPAARTHTDQPRRPSVNAVKGIVNSPVEVPELSLATSLLGLTIVLVLGVGLLVHRAGYRGERARR